MLNRLFYYYLIIFITLFVVIIRFAHKGVGYKGELGGMGLIGNTKKSLKSH